MALAAVVLPQTASAVSKDVITATVTGTAVAVPASGILTIYDNVTALHHTRSVEYLDHDGYSKTANLVNTADPLGVVLKSETIDNGCGFIMDAGSVNPAGGDQMSCFPVLHASQPALYLLHGDLLGRYCRVAPAGFTGSCPFNVHRMETATGSGPYLTVGDKDHGGLTEVDYYCNVAGVNYEVDVILPLLATAVDYLGVVRHNVPAEVTEIVLKPAGLAAPHAVLTLQ